LHYGQNNGKIADAPQRKVITITDAIIAGDGEGPLSPSPVPFGAMTFGLNVAAVEWVHAILMRFDPKKIPLLLNSFVRDKWPLVDFSPDAIKVHLDGELLPNPEKAGRVSKYFLPPAGWKGHCEKQNLD
jgi:uncharacterized protein (DUF362 family)